MTDVRGLAEKIYNLATDGDKYDLPCGFPPMESLLREAMDQADKFWRTYWQDHTKTEIIENQIKEARSAAFKEAAEIADGHKHLKDACEGDDGPMCQYQIADKLRRKSEGA